MVGNADEPLGAAGDVEIEYGNTYHFTKGQGGYGEKDSMQSQNRQTDQQAHQPGQNRSGNHGKEKRNTQFHGEDSRGIAANPGKGGTAQGELTGRQGQIEAEGKNGVDADKIDKASVDRKELGQGFHRIMPPGAFSAQAGRRDGERER